VCSFVVGQRAQALICGSGEARRITARTQPSTGHTVADRPEKKNGSVHHLSPPFGDENHIMLAIPLRMIQALIVFHHNLPELETRCVLGGCPLLPRTVIPWRITSAQPGAYKSLVKFQNEIESILVNNFPPLDYSKKAPPVFRSFCTKGKSAGTNS
jgi:hypothetical protein